MLINWVMSLFSAKSARSIYVDELRAPSESAFSSSFEESVSYASRIRSLDYLAAKVTITWSVLELTFSSCKAFIFIKSLSPTRLGSLLHTLNLFSSSLKSTALRSFYSNGRVTLKLNFCEPQSGFYLTLGMGIATGSAPIWYSSTKWWGSNTRRSTVHFVKLA